MLPYRLTLVGSFGLWLISAAACSDEKIRFDDGLAEEANGALAGGSGDALTPTDPGSSTDSADPANSTGSMGSIALPQTVTMTASGTVLCGDAPCACNNGVDDDGDGTVDGFDIECTGAIDNDEGSFATGIPGDNRDPKWQDCFFDGNSGHGDDRCRYPTECLTGELSLDDDACAVTQACRDNCQPRTPKGCDCFGCCAVPLPGGGEVNVLLTDTCSAEKVGDTEACPACVPSTECVPAPPVDPDPSDPGDPSTPDAGNPDPFDPECSGRTQCDEAGGCPVGEFCSQGCCLVIIE
jgi:hypothetical protein